MLNRRQFLLAAPAAATLARAATEPAARIRQVDIVHHTHTDVGYTELPSVVRDLQKRYLDIAVDTCQVDPAFRWTVESLLGLDDWWRATTAARHDLLLSHVKAGRIDVMALPFNQTPFLNAMEWRQMMSWIPDSLWRSMNIRAAMQNDVNGFPRAGVLLLLDRKIQHLVMGLNPDSGGPPFRRPTAFWWRMPDDRKMFVWLGEHYGSVMEYLKAARQDHRLLTGEESVRAAHADFVKHLRTLESEGYNYDRLILTFTHPLHYDNGGPFPTLSPFIKAWNKLGLEPRLRLVTATEAVFAMEKAVGGQIPELKGEWTDWWANGDASAPREVAASRRAKRFMAAVHSPVFGPVPARAGKTVEGILKNLCLFDEHTWGASRSISEPYSFETLGQFVEKSDLAYRPMGEAEALLARRVRSKIDGMPAGVYAINPAPVEISGWGVQGPNRTWIERLAANSVRAVSGDVVEAVGSKPAVKVDETNWPVAAAWPGMSKPLFDGPLGEFLCVGVVPPADRRTISRLHANPDAAKREEIRGASFRETAGAYEAAKFEETPHTLVYTQGIQHERLARATRRVELWKREPRARILVRFDRLSSLAPEVLYLGFTLPTAGTMPVVSSGGVPFTPYRDQLNGSCKDYLAIDGWAHYATADGDWLWVTRDAPLIAIGSPHVVERHQREPGNPHRVLAMVFDNCWHTNFVADSHGTFEFQFELAWRTRVNKPEDLAEALVAEPMIVSNASVHETAAEVDDLFRP